MILFKVVLVFPISEIACSFFNDGVGIFIPGSCVAFLNSGGDMKPSIGCGDLIGVKDGSFILIEFDGIFAVVAASIDIVEDVMLLGIAKGAKGDTFGVGAGIVYLHSIEAVVVVIALADKMYVIIRVAIFNIQRGSMIGGHFRCVDGELVVF